MPGGTLAWEIGRLRKQLDRSTADGSKAVAAIRADNSKVLTLAGYTPDPWQTTCLQSPSKRTMILASRQSGKSLTSAAMAVAAALTGPALVLLLSPTQRQSVELFRKCVDLLTLLDWPVPPTLESLTRVELVNGARIVSLPGSESTTRGYSAVDLMVIDEGAKVEDSLYRSVRPSLVVSGGKLVAVSSAFCRSGWFFECWSGHEDWERIKITADQCPRISQEALEEERQALGPTWFAMEYLCEFTEGNADSVFDASLIDTVFRDDVPPLLLEDQL